MKIRQKLILGALGFALLIGIVGYISVYKSHGFLTDAIGENSRILAQETLNEIDRGIYIRIEEILFLSQDPMIQDAVIRSNRKFDQMSDRQTYIEKKDQAWRGAPKKPEMPFIQQLSGTEISRKLQKRVMFYQKKYGFKVFPEIFVTNKYGVNAVQSGRTTDYQQSDEQWWQSGKKDGLFIGDVEYDKSTETYSMDIAVRMEDGEGKYIGVMKAVLNIKEIEDIIKNVRKVSGYKTANIELLSHNGEIIYETHRHTVFDAPAWIINEFKQKEAHIFYTVMDHPGEGEKLIAHAHSHGYRDFKGLGWFLILEYDTSEILAPAAILGNTILGFSLGVMIFAILFGLIFSQSISTPIIKLAEVAGKVSDGKLDVTVDVRSKDEIGSLGKTFNQMVAHLKSQEEKTEKQTNELTALYEVSNSIPYTADYQQLLKLIMASVFKIIDYDICGALLLNAQTANIIIKPSYSQSAQFCDEIKETLLREFAQFHNQEVDVQSESVRVVPVEDTVKTLKTRQFDKLRSLFNAPILVNGKIVGILNFSSVQENVFAAEEVKFIYTVTNQVSNAIERLQAMVKAEKSKMESMIESMREGAVMLDERGDVAVLNPQAREMLGFPFEGEIVRTALQEKMKHVNLDAALEEADSKNDIVVRDIVMPHNEKRILQCTITPVGSKKRRIGMVIIFRDVTKEKEVDSMKTEFISVVSHELRTPLSITKEGLNLILDKVAGDITEKQEMILSAAKDNMDRLARLINNVLDVSKMEAGKMETRKERIDIVQLADQVMSTFKIKAKEKNIDLHVRFADKSIDVFADRDKVIQVFTNLVNNALKFTLEGSIEVSGKVEGDFIECVVKDTGIGISKADLERTFVKFQQFGRTPGSGEKGTGLGLAIAKGIVEMHDGRIRVESELGVGTKFIFTLPKFSEDTYLNNFVGNGIKEAQKSNTRMSLLAMTIEGTKKDKSAFPEKKRLSYLENLENLLKEEVHRQGDDVFRDPRGCFITLADCSKDCTDSVCGRFKSILDEYLAREKLADKINLKIGSATYPNDGSSSMELLKKAIET